MSNGRNPPSHRGGVRVLLSEIILPLQGRTATRSRPGPGACPSRARSTAFSANARLYSAAPTRGWGKANGWTPLNEAAAATAPVVLGSPRRGHRPAAAAGALALFQMRDIEETEAPEPDYAAIEYAHLSPRRPRNEETRARAARGRAPPTPATTSTASRGDTPDRLRRDSRAPEEIPQDVALELARLDPGEVSTNLTDDGQRRVILLMLCGRTPRSGRIRRRPRPAEPARSATAGSMPSPRATWSSSAPRPGSSRNDGTPAGADLRRTRRNRPGDRGGGLGALGPGLPFA